MYRIGQKVCLWQVEQTLGSPILKVLRKVIVTITNIRTGVPGEFSGQPTTLQSLQGIGDDNKTYEKHWEVWPESQTSDFMDVWSRRSDGEGYRFWSPREAVGFYNAISASVRNSLTNLKIVDGKTGEEMKPEGDVVYCATHDEYSFTANSCLGCHMAKQDEEAEQLAS